MNFIELKQFLNVSRDFTYCLLHSPNFVHASKHGKYWHIDETELWNWIKQQIKRKDDLYAKKISIRTTD